MLDSQIWNIAGSGSGPGPGFKNFETGAESESEKVTPATSGSPSDCQVILQKQASKFEKQAKIGNLTEKQAQNTLAGKFN